MLFSQRIIIGTANLLWWTTTVYLSMFWLQQFQFQQSYATSDEPWTPNQTLLKMYWIEIIQWHCSGWILPTDLALCYPEMWACHLEWSYCLAVSQPSRQTVDHLGRLCIYKNIYCHTYKVITRKLPNFTCTWKHGMLNTHYREAVRFHL